MTSATSSHGTLLKMGDGGSPTETFTTVAEVGDISGPEMMANTSDATSHDSGGWTETITTVKDLGEVTFDVNLVPGDGTHDGSTGLEAAYLDGLAHNFKIVYDNVTGDPEDAFAALVTKFSKGAPVDGKLTASVTLKGTGAPTALAGGGI